MPRINDCTPARLTSLAPPPPTLAPPPPTVASTPSSDRSFSSDWIVAQDAFLPAPAPSRRPASQEEAFALLAELRRARFEGPPEALLLNGDIEPIEPSPAPGPSLPDTPTPEDPPSGPEPADPGPGGPDPLPSSPFEPEIVQF